MNVRLDKPIYDPRAKSLTLPAPSKTSMPGSTLTPVLNFQEAWQTRALLRTAKSKGYEVLIIQRDGNNLRASAGKVEDIKSSELRADSDSLQKVTVQLSPGTLSIKDAVKAHVSDLNDLPDVMTVGDAKLLRDGQFCEAALDDETGQYTVPIGPWQDGFASIKIYPPLEDSDGSNQLSTQYWIDRWKAAGVVMYHGRENVPQFPPQKPSPEFLAMLVEANSKSPQEPTPQDSKAIEILRQLKSQGS